jgi:GNAT superfamily N-acetyltransferase
MRIRDATLNEAWAIARVHVDSWRTTYRGLLPEAVLDRLSYEQRAEVWHQRLTNVDPDLYALVVEDGGQIVGVISGGRNRSGDPAYEGTVSILYLLESHQGRGLGRQLMRAAAERLAQRDIRSLQLWVQMGNPATQFYERLGGRYLRSQPFDWTTLPWVVSTGEPLVVTELEYGWPDTRVLLDA